MTIPPRSGSISGTFIAASIPARSASMPNGVARRAPRANERPITIDEAVEARFGAASCARRMVTGMVEESVPMPMNRNTSDRTPDVWRNPYRIGVVMRSVAARIFRWP